MEAVEKEFQNLHEVLNKKERDTKEYFSQVLKRQREALDKEIQDLGNISNKTESLIDIVEFATRSPTTFLCEGIIRYIYICPSKSTRSKVYNE